MTRKSKWLTKEGARWAESHVGTWKLPGARERLASWSSHATECKAILGHPLTHNHILKLYNEARRSQAKFAYLIELLLEKERAA